jgi:hypothetical protein
MKFSNQIAFRCRKEIPFKIQGRLFAAIPSIPANKAVPVSPSPQNKWVFGGIFCFLQAVYSGVVYYYYTVQIQVANLRLEQAFLEERLAATTAQRDAALVELGKVKQSYFSWLSEKTLEAYNWIGAGGPFC